MKPKGTRGVRQQMVLGQPSWRVATKDVEAFVTEQGGHLGPVTFDRQARKIQPFSVAPWAGEKPDPSLPAMLQSLRGDFFCLPFGGNATPFRRERHPAHGETANAIWKFGSLDEQEGRVRLHLSLKTKIRPGRVDKEIFLVEGQPVVYSRHTVSGMSGSINPGHHPMLKFPAEPASGILSTSRFVYGQVFPGTFEHPEQRGYSSLMPGAEFSSLERVRTQTGGMADLSRYPARRGFEDLVMLVSDVHGPFAWTAVTFPKQRYVWFALKDPRVLRETIFWISNGGRHYPPWNGRHVDVMGLEEVTSYFHYGLTEAVAENPISAKGFPTYLTLEPSRPLVVNYIMGTVPIPSGFDQLVSIDEMPGGVVLQSISRKTVEVPVVLPFLRSAEGWSK